MQYAYDRSFKFKINDDFWEFYLITEEEAVELDDDDEGFKAITFTKEDGRCMFVVEGNVTKQIIGHELFHVYVSYFNIDSANLDVDTFEEIIAEFLETSLDKFVKMRNKLFNRYKKLEGS